MSGLTTFERFQRDTDKHQMTTLLDQGTYRHLLFKEPGTGFYWFELITAPGILTITSDMGTYSFRRIDDMFRFFGWGTDSYINLRYWGEKLASISTEGYKTHSAERFTEWVNDDWKDRLDEFTPAQRVKIRAAIDNHFFSDWSEFNLEFGEESYRALNEFPEVEGFEYTDAWECNWDDYNYHFIWCCHAIRWGIGQYRREAAAFRAPYTSARWAA